MNDARLLKLLQALLSTPEPVAGAPICTGPTARETAREALAAAMVEEGRAFVVSMKILPGEETQVVLDATRALLRTIEGGKLRSHAAIGGVLRTAIKRRSINAQRDRGWLFWKREDGTHPDGEAREPLDNIAAPEPATDRAAHLPDLGAVLLRYPTMPENYRRALRRWYAEQDAEAPLPSIEEEVLTEVLQEQGPLGIARTPAAVIEGEVARRVALLQRHRARAFAWLALHSGVPLEPHRGPRGAGGPHDLLPTDPAEA